MSPVSEQLPGSYQSVQNQGETAGWAASGTLQESVASGLLSTFFPLQALSSSVSQLLPQSPLTSPSSFSPVLP